MSDCEMPSFFNSKTGVKSRKDRRCCECRAVIPAGEPHYVGAGHWTDGGFQTYRQHLDCKEACVEIRDLAQGECIGFGELMEVWQDYAHNKSHKEFRDVMARVLWRQRKHLQVAA